ncbi:oxygen regulatory protein NreC [Geobacter sp. OR-1]|uniref:helix-turn-helix transcriptional regulator n=1 Tax=Geobacter sp. OR-1 TaxID=1266765 RepID=UPI0005436594|nr:response regulator transcription factor [Geobacter sp. OR-1]GAM10152.1 oxygen regulatory protein NreC [Geobacter sp. OR-1]
MSINIMINLSNLVLSNALAELLTRAPDGYQASVSNGSAHNGSNAPALILVDASSLKPELFTNWPSAKVILFDTGLQENEIISILLSHKLDGVIATDTETSLFLKALSVIHAGQVWIDNTKLKALLNYAESSARAKNTDKISRKEQEVIVLVSQGYKNKEIADRLNISEQTVKAHISHIFRKVKVTNRSQLVPLAMKYRLPPIA